MLAVQSGSKPLGQLAMDQLRWLLGRRAPAGDPIFLSGYSPVGGADASRQWQVTLRGGSQQLSYQAQVRQKAQQSAAE